MEPTTLAYLAGILDSDGFISAHRTTKTTRRGEAEWTSTYHSARVGIAGTRRQPHDLAALHFGGSVNAYEPKNPAHRVQFNWVASGRIAAVVLRTVRPYLLVKAEQADLALQLQDLVMAQFAEIKATCKPPYRISPEMIAPRERLYLAIRGLNQDRNPRRQLSIQARLTELETEVRA